MPLLALAAACNWARPACRSLAAPLYRPVRNTPPSRYFLTVDCTLVGLFTGVPTMSSWPTWPSRPSAVRVAETQSPPGPTETVTGDGAGAPPVRELDAEFDGDEDGRNTRTAPTRTRTATRPSPTIQSQRPK